MTDFLQQLAVFLRVAGTRNGPKTRTPPLFCITWKYLTGPVVARRGPSWPVVTRRTPSDPVGPRRTPSDPVGPVTYK